MRLAIWSLVCVFACGKPGDPDDADSVGSGSDGSHSSGDADADADADVDSDVDGSTSWDADGTGADDGASDVTGPSDPGDGHRVRCFEWSVSMTGTPTDWAACVAEVGSAMKMGARPDCAIQEAANFDSETGSEWTEVDVWPGDREMEDAKGTTDCAAGEDLPGGVNCYTWDDSDGATVTERAACITLAEGSLVAGARPTCATQDLLFFEAATGSDWTSVENWPTGRQMWEVSGTTDCASGAPLPSDVACFTWTNTPDIDGVIPEQRAACVVLHNEAVLVGGRPECAIQSAVEYDVGGTSGWTEVDVWPSDREMNDAAGTSDCAGGQPLND